MPDPASHAPHLRAADADRARVAELLGKHLSAGRLTVEEYDDRLARAYTARTYGELDPLTKDLPPLERPAAAPAPAPAGSSSAHLPGHAGWGAWGVGHWAGSNGVRAAWASWAGTGVIVLTIWLVTSLVAGWQYFWPIWVIGPWGAVLLAQTLGGRFNDGGRDRDRRGLPFGG
ncbi:DUF1707 SHOCT-like domain-containing protein [Modestobacter marinus]|uniref:DUF1707 SHOCT-like domain-containing protein n=1 Tax=Modestobacter marinus TaxID=477641 RepID=UPI001C956F3A|nr:DUF1707 domain-containing protein [Modestobacter marinus]